MSDFVDRILMLADSVGESVRGVWADGEAVLVLTEAVPLDGSGYSFVFEGPSGVGFEQGTVRFTVGDDTIDLFTVPFADDGTTRRYQVVVN